MNNILTLDNIDLKGHVIIEGKKVYAFGLKTISFGMNAVVFNPEDTTISDIKKLDNIFLNPFRIPNSLQIFALYGIKENYDIFYKNHLIQYAEYKARQETELLFGEYNWDKIDVRKKEIIDNFKPLY